jgi:hypothetical protein
LHAGRLEPAFHNLGQPAEHVKSKIMVVLAFAPETFPVKGNGKHVADRERTEMPSEW